MNFLKRAIVNLTRNKLVNIILIFLFTSLIIFSLSAIYANRMIENNKSKILETFPPIVIIESDDVALAMEGWRLFREILETEGEIVEDIFVPYPIIDENLLDKISQLPYVQDYSFSAHINLFSRGLRRYRRDWVRDYISLSNMFIFGLETFEIKGVNRSNFFELNQGIIEIIEGDTFTEEQINYGKPVMIISSQFAQMNNLKVGSKITMENLGSGGGATLSQVYNDEYLVFQEIFEMEIIGIYELTRELTPYEPLALEQFGVRQTIDENAHIRQEIQKLNKIYVPLAFAQARNNNFVRNMNRLLLEQDEMLINPYTSLRTENIFFLESATMLPDFHEAVAPLLPEFSHSRDIADNFDLVFVSLNYLVQLSRDAKYLLIISTIIIMFLIGILTVKSRYYEIGVYLSLGSPHKEIIKQFLLEKIIIAIIAFILGLTIGQNISRIISHNLIMQEMSQVYATGRTHTLVYGNHIIGRNDHITDWLVPRYEDVNTILEEFDATLSMVEILTFVTVGITIVIIFTALPTYCTLKKNNINLLREKEG